jgi:hypothetical protein
MKTMLFVLCLVFCATAALGQAGGAINNQPQILEFPSHTLRAMQQPMAQEQSLLFETPGGYTYAQGERPLSEFVTVSYPTPLGDLARILRKEHATAKKAKTVWQN